MTQESEPAQKVLFLNPRSGGGRAGRLHLAKRCRDLGVRPVVLGPTDDLRQLAQQALDGGATVLGMAGGDGSQAALASVASRHAIPLVVVPTGTRNHFALDLGLDPDDPTEALQAFVDGVDVTVDLGEVNGRGFVNNASAGIYGSIVQSPEYRDAKLRTSLEALPEMLDPRQPEPDLRFTLPSGQRARSAQVILVSNNPYRLPAPHGAARPRLDGGVLGVVAVMLPRLNDVDAVARLEGVGERRPPPGFEEWTAREFEVDSGAPIDLGIDGEAATLDPPLHFTTRPGALVVRLPRAARERAEAGRAGPLPSPLELPDLLRLIVVSPRPPSSAGDAPEPSAGPRAAGAVGRRLRHLISGWDGRVYEALADSRTSALDRPMRGIARFADHSKPWLVSAALMAVAGPRGRRAALAGLAAVGVTSLVVNQPLKWAGGRRRPDRVAAGVPRSRWVPIPESTSFPSGHAASAAAFATAAGHVLPLLRGPLGAAAAAVCLSRVYTGVHYPSDVVAGALIGASVGRVTSMLVARAYASPSARRLG
ncbi:MAG TPA: phosphatase PAP2 family protein [Actinomycetes bacterium]|nr:phosphatase PAP2 family protein [Actinomycetes bacterium]